MMLKDLKKLSKFFLYQILIQGEPNQLMTLIKIYLVSIHPLSLGGLLTQLVPVHAGGAAVVLLLRVRGVAVVGPEECSRPGISSKLHLSQLLPGPVGVKIGGPDEGQVDPK